MCVKMNVMNSEKNKTLKLIGGYKFRFHKFLKNETERWSCTVKTCKCFAKFSNNNCLVESFNEHNHEKLSEIVLIRNKLSNTLKRKAVDHMFDNPSKILQTELKSGDIENLTTKDILLVKRNIHNARASVLPKLPNSLTEVHEVLKNIEIKTNKDEYFLLVNNNETNILGFSTLSNLKIVCSLDSIFVDGTFKSCPKFYCQLFTIHCMRKNSYIPLVYFLLPSKTINCYVNAFQHLVEECKKNNLQFNPLRVYADFEKAIHTAATTVWPYIQVRGCRFHLEQSWHRKIQQLRLNKDYKKKNTEISNFLQICFGLPFLNPQNVYNCFTDDIMAIQPQNARVIKFTDYILQKYIKNDAEFPPLIWAEFLASTIRTTDNCEVFHRKLNSFFNSSHPNIFNFINILKNIQCETYITLQSQDSINKKSIEKEAYIQQKMDELLSNKTTQFEFVWQLSFKCLAGSV